MVALIMGNLCYSFDGIMGVFVFLDHDLIYYCSFDWVK